MDETIEKINKKVKKEYIKIKSKKIKKETYDFLHDHFIVDDTNALVKVHMEYENFSDLFNGEYFEKGYILNDSFQDKLADVIKYIPDPYTMDIEINIKNYGNHTKEECKSIYLKGINETLNNADGKIKRYSKWSFFLLVIGILFLVINIVFLSLYNEDKVNSAFFSQTLHDVLTEIFDIAAWVFVWEAVTLYFMEREKLIFGITKSKEKIHSVTFADEKKPTNLSK